MNPREILGVSANASMSEIKQAFREAAKAQHPDLSNSPEAAEAFARIKKAHDALMKESIVPRKSSATVSTAARAYAATAQTTYRAYSQTATTNKEDIEHIQELDDLARKSTRFFKRNKVSDEVKKHRKKLRINERRIRGLY